MTCSAARTGSCSWPSGPPAASRAASGGQGWSRRPPATRASASRCRSTACRGPTRDMDRATGVLSWLVTVTIKGVSVVPVWWYFSLDMATQAPGSLGLVQDFVNTLEMEPGPREADVELLGTPE